METYFHETERHLFGDHPRFSTNRPSVPLKPWPRRPDITIAPGNLKSRNAPTPREATALIILAKANGQSEIRAGMRLARRFATGNGEWVFEKGCGQDVVRAEIAGWVPGQQPEDDVFVISDKFADWLSAQGAATASRLAHYFAEPFPSSFERV